MNDFRRSTASLRGMNVLSSASGPNFSAQLCALPRLRSTRGPHTSHQILMASALLSRALGGCQPIICSRRVRLLDFRYHFRPPLPRRIPRWARVQPFPYQKADERCTVMIFTKKPTPRPRTDHGLALISLESERLEFSIFFSVSFFPFPAFDQRRGFIEVLLQTRTGLSLTCSSAVHSSASFDGEHIPP